MELLNTSFDLDGFLEKLSLSTIRVLLLDYDGTLSPFTVQRDKAVPHPGIRQMLERLRSDKRNVVIVVSGRAVDDLTPLLDMNPAPEIWGSHGYEHLNVHGLYSRSDIPDDSRNALDHAKQLIAANGLERHMEVKPLSLAVHWRGFNSNEASHMEQQVRELWDPLLRNGALHMHVFDGGIELRVPGRTKGDVVRTVLKEHGDEAMYAFFGDDYTDEDAFNALGERGLRVLVRAKPRDTAADIRIEPPEELLEFLKNWTTRVEL